jgi:hypothetical protein
MREKATRSQKQIDGVKMEAGAWSVVAGGVREKGEGLQIPA